MAQAMGRFLCCPLVRAAFAPGKRAFTAAIRNLHAAVIAFFAQPDMLPEFGRSAVIGTPLGLRQSGNSVSSFSDFQRGKSKPVRTEGIERRHAIATPVCRVFFLYPIEECHLTAPIRATARVQEPVSPGVARGRLAARKLCLQVLLSVAPPPQPLLLRFQEGSQWSVLPVFLVVASVQQAVAELRFGS
jgi:hypothetical protein